MTAATPGAAEELTAAAEKLRSLVTFLGDNRGPWKVGTPPSGYPQSISNKGVPYCVADCHESPDIPVFTIAPYIAAMHPGVGKALADWLGCLAMLDPSEWGGDECGWCGENHALAVARVLTT